MFIEEGVMNFWAMWGALGAFTCSAMLLLLNVYDRVKKRRRGQCGELIISSDFCRHERPQRKVLCQLPKDHEGNHSAIVFWESETNGAEALENCEK